MSRSPWRYAALALGAALTLLVAACGSPAGGGGATGGDATPADEVFAEVDALTGDERRARLIELAEQEGNTLSIYTSLNADIAEIIVPAFEEEFGITVELYRADSETVLQRVLQESSASFAGADIVETNANELAVLSNRELTGHYEGEEQAKINQEFQYDRWTATRLNVFAPAWNTGSVTGDLVPTSWTDLADPKYDGIVSLEVGDYDWYMTLHGYLQEQGMSAAEVDQFFADVVQGAKVAKGHSGQVELLSAGEFGVVAASYSYLTAKARTLGAPVDDQPFVQPVIARANGAGLLRSSARPATSMLFLDWYLADGQQLLLDNGLTPVLMADGSDPMAGVDFEPVDVQQLLDEATEWSERYDRLLQGGEQLPAS